MVRELYISVYVYVPYLSLYVYTCPPHSQTATPTEKQQLTNHTIFTCVSVGVAVWLSEMRGTDAYISASHLCAGSRA